MKNRLIFIGLLLLSPLAQAADVEAGKKKAEGCAACHGADGNGVANIYPKLAGQHEDYLRTALKRYQTRERENAMMNAMAGPLTDEDIANIAAYYAQLPGILEQRPVAR